MSRTITQEEYLQVQGLMFLAKQNYTLFQSLEKALGKLLSEKPDSSGYYGLVSDAVWGNDISADQLIEMLEITVDGGEHSPH